MMHECKLTVIHIYIYKHIYMYMYKMHAQGKQIRVDLTFHFSPYSYFRSTLVSKVGGRGEAEHTLVGTLCI